MNPMVFVAAGGRLLARFLRKADKRVWMVVGVVVAVAAMQAQYLMDVGIRLGSTPLDPRTGILIPPSKGDLEDIFTGKAALCVGCTKGIGRGIAEALSEVGASPVAVVGRTAAPTNQFAADLSTVKGCHSLSDALKEKGTVYDYVFLTVGVWPNFRDPFTADGLERTLAIDLLARHVVLSRLVEDDLLADGAVIVNTLASAQQFPFVNKQSIKHRLTTRRPPTSLFGTLFPIAVAADAYLSAAAKHFRTDTTHQQISRKQRNLTFAGVFPGVVKTDVQAATLPAWALPLVKAAMTPFARSPRECGFAHLAIAARAPSDHDCCNGVTFWTHLLEGRLAHHLAYDADLIDLVWDVLANHSTVLRSGGAVGLL